jgi:hypothetical protein
MEGIKTSVRADKDWLRESEEFCVHGQANRVGTGSNALCLAGARNLTEALRGFDRGRKCPYDEQVGSWQ